METETLNARSALSDVFGSQNPLSFTFDLPTLIENMKNSHSWANGELNSLILLKTPDKKIMLTALHKGTEIDSFQANDSITFQIIEGKMKFHTRRESVILEKGQSLTLHEKIKYSLLTKEETFYLLTISSGNLRPVQNLLSWRF
jgi:quercetin dioxygenase-like cupin family protein